MQLPRSFLKAMTDFTLQRRSAWTGLAAGLLCLAGVVPSAAQTPGGEPPVVVGRRQATQLLINQVTPEYPPLAKVNYIQGQVRVEVRVSKEGRVTRVHVVHGHPLLAAAAVRAVQHWLYRPFIAKGGPAGFLTTVNLNFVLRSKKIEQVPLQPEADLSRQVKPPKVLTGRVDPGCASSVHMRVLLDDKGQVIDTQPLKGSAPQLEEAMKAVEQWTFNPARWGTMTVPWYLEVDVPVPDSTACTIAADPGGK